MELAASSDPSKARRDQRLGGDHDLTCSCSDHGPANHEQKQECLSCVRVQCVEGEAVSRLNRGGKPRLLPAEEGSAPDCPVALVGLVGQRMIIPDDH